MARGTVFRQEWEQRVVDEREAAQVTERCRWCEQAGVKNPWMMEGTVKVTRDAYLAHRLDAHPEVNPPVRRKRHRPIGQIVINRNLDDNIAAARKQGASGWAGGQ